MYEIVLLRHGESLWNLENRFTGWIDIGLSNKGVDEARIAGQQLKSNGFVFDLAFTSVLKRAKETLNICLKEMTINQILIEKFWQLNERHYGALQGLNKKETAKKFGDEQVFKWRRSYDIRPPFLKKDDQTNPALDIKYSKLDLSEIPLGESLKDTVNRILPIWLNNISNNIKSGKKILIVAHGNSLRALIKNLDKLSDKEITSINIPTGIPLVYKLDSKLNSINHYYLNDK